MKHFTLIVLIALAANASTANAQQTTPRRPHTALPSTITTAHAHNGRIVPKAAATLRPESKSTYLPKEQTEYMYMNGKWKQVGTYSFTYDEQGRQTRIDNNDGDAILRTERTYTDNGQLATETSSTSEDGGTTFNPSEKKVQTYDPSFTQLTLTKDKYIWLNDDWKPSYDSFHRTVERNADGNVTSLTLAVPYNGSFEETQRIANTFDDDTKKATEFQLYELGQDFNWSRVQYIRNLVWRETNGQLVDQYDAWMGYDNKLSSGTIADNDPTTGEIVDFGFINIAYGDDGKGYVETIDYTDKLSRSVTSMETTDDNGSYTYTYTYYEDLNGDSVIDTATEVADYTKELGVCDAHGNMTLQETYQLNSSTGKEELAGATRYEYTYDPAHGDAEKELTISEYDYDAKEYTPTMRIVTTAYTSATSGISDTKTVGCTPNGTYTMMGTKANGHTGKGLFIVKSNGKWLKVAK